MNSSRKWRHQRVARSKNTQSSLHSRLITYSVKSYLPRCYVFKPAVNELCYNSGKSPTFSIYPFLFRLLYYCFLRFFIPSHLFLTALTIRNLKNPQSLNLPEVNDSTLPPLLCFYNSEEGRTPEMGEIFQRVPRYLSLGEAMNFWFRVALSRNGKPINCMILIINIVHYANCADLPTKLEENITVGCDQSLNPFGGKVRHRTVFCSPDSMFIHNC